MSVANPRWGAPRIHGELLKLGIDISQATVAKYMVRHRTPPSQTWKTFLRNHVKDLVSTDYFVVPTASFRLLFVFIVLSHDRRRPVHFGVTAHPTAEWMAHQLIEAFPWDEASRYLLRDREGSYGKLPRQPISWGSRSAHGSPLAVAENVERFIGSIRRECLDHVIVFSECSLRRLLRSYFEYYGQWRTHLALDKDALGPPLCEASAAPMCDGFGGEHFKFRPLDKDDATHGEKSGGVGAAKAVAECTPYNAAALRPEPM